MVTCGTMVSETSLTIQGPSGKKCDMITFPSNFQAVIPSGSRKLGTLVSKARFPLQGTLKVIGNIYPGHSLKGERTWENIHKELAKQDQTKLIGTESER